MEAHNNPHALLINPWIHDFAAYDFWQRPLGLLELGSCLREMGFDVSLIDCLDSNYPGRSEPLPKKKSDGSQKFDQVEIKKPEVLKNINRKFKRYGIPIDVFLQTLKSIKQPDIVLIASVMTYWYTGVAEAVRLIKSVFPTVPIILGGVYATLLPEHALKNTGVDFVATGDFKESLPQIFSNLKLPNNFPKSYPFPSWDLYKRLEFVAIRTTRGCPFRCPYCSVATLTPKFSQRDTGEVVEEVNRLEKEFGISHIAFLDDALRCNDDHLTAILEGVISKGVKVNFHVINAMHLKGLNQELATLLKRSGVSTLRFGLETLNEDVAGKIGKKASRDDLTQATYHLKKAGYDSKNIGVYLLLGLPGQRPAQIESDITAVLSAGVKPYLSQFSPVPGSPMWSEAVLASKYDIELEPLFQNNTLTPCAHPELDEKQMSHLKNIIRDWFQEN